jgi:hypothetical protein
VDGTDLLIDKVNVTALNLTSVNSTISNVTGQISTIVGQGAAALLF